MYSILTQGLSLSAWRDETCTCGKLDSTGELITTFLIWPLSAQPRFRRLHVPQGPVRQLRTCISASSPGYTPSLAPYLKDKDPPHSSQRKSEEHRNPSSCYCSANIPTWSLFSQPEGTIIFTNSASQQLHKKSSKPLSDDTLVNVRCVETVL